MVIEDNEERIGLFKDWLPEDVKAMYVRSAGRAVRVIELDKGAVYAGICLDHDLNEQIVAEEERGVDGVEVVRRIVRWIDRNVPILVHSMNFRGGTAMTRTLDAHGFSVTRVPFRHMNEGTLLEWLQNVRAEWEFSHTSGDL